MQSVPTVEKLNNQNDGTTMSMICELATSDVLSFAEELASTDKKLRCHLAIIKWFGVVIIVSFCAVPVFVILSHHACSLPVSDKGMRPNTTEYLYTKQFYLQESLYATVCNQQGYVFDIRQFDN